MLFPAQAPIHCTSFNPERKHRVRCRYILVFVYIGHMVGSRVVFHFMLGILNSNSRGAIRRTKITGFWERGFATSTGCVVGNAAGNNGNGRRGSILRIFTGIWGWWTMIYLAVRC